MIRLFDSHAHLGAKEFALDYDKVVAQSLAAGVMHIANCSDSLESFTPTLDIKAKYPNVCLSCLGIHPEFVGMGPKYIDRAIKEMVKNIDKIDAIGEVGLDYHYTQSLRQRAEERDLFTKMCELAKKYSKPLIVHSRDADEDSFAILKKSGVEKVDLHCYSGNTALAKEYLASGMDVRFGVGGIITFKTGTKSREVASQLPLDRIMLETDSPSLAPNPLRGTRNEPKNLIYIVKVLSDLRFEDLDKVASQTYDSAERFYGIGD